MQKYFIDNRKKQKIAVIVDDVVKPKGTAFVAHGLSGFKEQKQIQTVAEAFTNDGYTTIRWDAANTIGESGGSLEEATLTNYYEDFEDVITWAKTKSWFHKNLILAGHSLGAASTLLYASTHPSEVSGIVPLSCFISGKSYKKVLGEKAAIWEQNGFMEEISYSKPGVVKRIKWECMKDLLTYDMNLTAKKVHAPTLFIVSGKDEYIPLAEEEKLFAAIASKKKQYYMLPDSLHTFTKKEELIRLFAVISKWLETPMNY